MGARRSRGPRADDLALWIELNWDAFLHGPIGRAYREGPWPRFRDRCRGSGAMAPGVRAPKAGVARRGSRCPRTAQMAGDGTTRARGPMSTCEAADGPSCRRRRQSHSPVHALWWAKRHHCSDVVLGERHGLGPREGGGGHAGRDVAEGDGGS